MSGCGRGPSVASSPALPRGSQNPSLGRRGAGEPGSRGSEDPAPAALSTFCFFPELPSTLYSESRSWQAFASEADDLGRAAGARPRWAVGGRRPGAGTGARLAGSVLPSASCARPAAGARHMEAAEELTPGPGGRALSPERRAPRCLPLADLRRELRALLFLAGPAVSRGPHRGLVPGAGAPGRRASGRRRAGARGATVLGAWRRAGPGASACARAALAALRGWPARARDRPRPVSRSGAFSG